VRSGAPLVNAPLPGAELEVEEPVALEAVLETDEAAEDAFEEVDEATEVVLDAVESTEVLEADSAVDVGRGGTEVMVTPTAAQSARAAASADSMSLGLSLHESSMQYVTVLTKLDLEHKHLLSVGSQPVVSALAMQGPAQSGKP
jgi:hypothetical protein